MKKTPISSEVVGMALQLKRALDRLYLSFGLEAVEVENAKGEHVTLDLIEKRLTNGSKVYSLRIS